MILYKNLASSVICNKCAIPNYSHLSWDKRVCFNIWKGWQWTIIMSLNTPTMLILITNYVSINWGIVTPRSIPNVIVTNLNDAIDGSKVLVVLIFLLMFGILCQHSILMWIFFMSCKNIIKGSKWKNYEVCKNSNISHMRAYGKHVYKWNNWSKCYKGS